jgi:hypothetical protein
MPSVAAPIEERAGKRNGSLAVKPFCHEKSILLQWSNGRKAVSISARIQYVLGSICEVYAMLQPAHQQPAWLTDSVSLISPDSSLEWCC